MTIASPQARPSRPRPDDPGYDALDDLWSRLQRPFDVVHTVAVLTGLSPAVVSQLVGTLVATSPEAEALLDSFPRTVRGLASSIETQSERCKGELRGPVLWSETMSARASSFGDPDLYVCMTPSRAYDVEENRVLVWALTSVRDAARDATEYERLQVDDDPVLRAAKRNGSDAGRFLEHPSLQKVGRVRPTARMLKRTRGSRKRAVYDPALAMVDRAADPLTADDLRRWCDRRTRAQVAVLLGLAHRLEARTGTDLPGFRVEQGALYAGPLQLLPARLLGDPGPSGVLVGSLLVDVPAQLDDPSRTRADADLARRAGGRRHRSVLDEADLDAAIDEAIELARERA